MKEVCPCGRGTAFDTCCGRYIGTGEAAPDAESLMRSRYTAFVRGDVPHLLATWHPSHRPASLELDGSVKWLGLELKHSKVLDESHAEVEFVARSRIHGRGQRLHERSRFVRENGFWYYIDGEHTP